jgi:hypothetical protein
MREQQIKHDWPDERHSDSLRTEVANAIDEASKINSLIWKMAPQGEAYYSRI